jgi:hypothetical protein
MSVCAKEASSIVEHPPCPNMQPTEVATSSTPEAVGLAKRLSAAGARMYGAFWCSHCYEQKEAFGREAVGSLPYVECFPEGWKKVCVLVVLLGGGGELDLRCWQVSCCAWSGKAHLATSVHRTTLSLFIWRVGGAGHGDGARMPDGAWRAGGLSHLDHRGGEAQG